MAQVRGNVRAIYWAALLSFGGLLLGQNQRPKISRAESCRKFVQEFYDWYVPKAAAFPDRCDKNPPRSSDLALKERRSFFSAALYHRLLEDSRAQDKADELVSLDFDPFLNTQDPGDPPGDPYRAFQVDQRSGNCFVKVYRTTSGKKEETPTVVPELFYQRDHWVFVNFHFPDGANLLGSLEELRKERAKAHK
jgi:hypothetical protein